MTMLLWDDKKVSTQRESAIAGVISIHFGDLAPVLNSGVTARRELTLFSVINIFVLG